MIPIITLFYAILEPSSKFIIYDTVTDRREDIIRQADQYEKIGRKFLKKAEELRKKADEEDLD